MGFLTLTRKTDQGIYIDVPAGPARRIEVDLGRMGGGTARLCINADKEVRVLRKELESEVSK
jgi:sRNA-binding carbon storage regulator CsrA